MSHVWRQSNRMTTISQYAINFVVISLGFCRRINWYIIFAHGLIRHYTLPAELYHACFLLCKLTVVCQLGDRDRENYLEQLLAEVES